MDYFIKTGWILMCFFTLSCERNIELSVELPEPFAVLNASLSADSLITATVSRTVREYYSNPGAESVYSLDKAASITVFVNDSKQGMMEKGEKNGQYRLPGYYPSAGDKVRMEVQTDDFAPLSAEVSIPSRPEILSVDTQMYHILSHYYSGGYNIGVKLRFKEPANETNYYLLTLSGDGVAGKDTLTKIEMPLFVTHNEDLLLEKLDAILFSNYYFAGDNDFSASYYYDPSYFIFNDEAIHGDEYTLKFTLNNAFSSYESDSLSITATCRICLYSLSESYYLYYRSKLLQWKQHEDPFGSVGLREPVPTYTNIKNGYGLLSAKQVAVYELKVAPGDMPLPGY
jgi:hypothetical protein